MTDAGHNPHGIRRTNLGWEAIPINQRRPRGAHAHLPLWKFDKNNLWEWNGRKYEMADAIPYDTMCAIEEKLCGYCEHWWTTHSSGIRHYYCSLNPDNGCDDKTQYTIHPAVEQYRQYILKYEESLIPKPKYILLTKHSIINAPGPSGHIRTDTIRIFGDGHPPYRLTHYKFRHILNMIHSGTDPEERSTSLLAKFNRQLRSLQEQIEFWEDLRRDWNLWHKAKEIKTKNGVKIRP